MAPPRKRHSHLGAWRVQQERGQIPGDEPPPRPFFAPVAQVGELMPSLMKSMGLEQNYWAQALEAEWPQIVGPQLQRHTRPGKLQSGTLVVFVANSVWLNEIRQVGLVPLLEKLQARFGASKIRQLRLQIDPEPRRS